MKLHQVRMLISSLAQKTHLIFYIGRTKYVELEDSFLTK